MFFEKHIFNLSGFNHQYDCAYFEIHYVNKKYHLYFGYQEKLGLIISDDYNFNNKPIQIITNYAPGAVFCILNDTKRMYLLVGCHISCKEKNETEIPDLVWPKRKRLISNHNIKRKDRKNGMYLLESFDGIKWNEISEKPVLHSFMNSKSCKLGEVCYDTHPCLVKKNNLYYYYGRLNSSLDERKNFVSTSRDLINWSNPEKINIINEVNGDFKNNYYSLMVFIYDNTFYAFAPHFKACGTTKRKTIDGEITLYLKSNDGLNWEIINEFLKTKNRYEKKVNCVLIEDNEIKVFFRENVLSKNQSLSMYNLFNNKNIIQNEVNEINKIENNFKFKTGQQIVYNDLKGKINNNNFDGTYWIILENGFEEKDVPEDKITDMII